MTFITMTSSVNDMGLNMATLPLKASRKATATLGGIARGNDRGNDAVIAARNDAVIARGNDTVIK